MNLFQHGDFKLHGGTRSPWKINCDALTDEDIATLALLVSKMVGPFSSVEGIPRGGLRLAKALEHSAQAQGRHLIVDDVLTTGSSMARARAAVARPVPWPWEEKVVGAVIFARGPLPDWIHAVFRMPGGLWTG